MHTMTSLCYLPKRGYPLKPAHLQSNGGYLMQILGMKSCIVCTYMQFA